MDLDRSLSRIDERLKINFIRRFFMSIGKGTVPENGERILLFGEVPIETVDSVWWRRRGQVGVLCYGHNELGEVTLVFSRDAMRDLMTKAGEFFKKVGDGAKKSGRKEKLRLSPEVSLDLSQAEISVVASKPEPDDISFCYLKLEGRRGGSLHLDLGLKIARRIREKLNRYFTKEGPRQVWRLAHIEDIWKKNAEENEARLRKTKEVFEAFFTKERERQTARLA
jgi:hypothetical protein